MNWLPLTKQGIIAKYNEGGHCYVGIKPIPTCDEALALADTNQVFCKPEVSDEDVLRYLELQSQIEELSSQAKELEKKFQAQFDLGDLDSPLSRVVFDNTYGQISLARRVSVTADQSWLEKMYNRVRRTNLIKKKVTYVLSDELKRAIKWVHSGSNPEDMFNVGDVFDKLISDTLASITKSGKTDLGEEELRGKLYVMIASPSAKRDKFFVFLTEDCKLPFAVASELVKRAVNYRNLLEFNSILPGMAPRYRKNLYKVCKESSSVSNTVALTVKSLEEN